MVKIMDAARYFVFLSYHNDYNSLTPLKLQKLLYLAQGWSYVWDNRPLFNESFEAWQYGPVSTEVYAHFKRYGYREIPEAEAVASLGDSEAEETIEAIWRNYGSYSAYELVELTHGQLPWKVAYASGRKINNRDIKEYFQSTY